MTSRLSKTIRLLPVAVAIALLVPAADVPAETCLTPAAARGLVATSYVDTLLNGADLEDASFFTATSGVPNIFILLGNATSMRRLPPNGPATYPGTRPPLVNPLDSGSTLSPFNANCATMANCPVMGCGDDPVSALYAGDGTVIKWLRDRTFQPSCGATVHAEAAGTYKATFSDGTTVDYAAEAKACPYYSQGSNAIVPANDANHPGGYDPDFYCGSNGDTVACNGTKPNFFDKDLVYHDTNVDAPSNLPANAADGWTALSVNAAARKNGTILAIDNFCSGLYGGSDQGALSKASICTSCLRTRGFFLDGRKFRATLDGAGSFEYPSIYFTGNWLNFYPPKLVMARKILKDVVMSKVNVRMGMAHFGDTGADHTSSQWQPLAPTCDMPDSNWTSSRSTYMSALNSYHFNRNVRLARALLDVGQYYHTPELPWFGLDDTWNANTGNSSSGNATNSQSICYSCQASSVIVLVDRAPGAAEATTLPGGTVTAEDVETQYAGSTSTGLVANASGGGTGIPTTLCADCEKFPSDKDWLNNPIRVSWYLHNFDLRKNAENTEDCAQMGGKQVLDVYTLGLGAEGDAATMLMSMSRMGGGSYEAANDAPTLRRALDTMFERISERQTSFSVATVSTLQTTSGQSVIVPRFEPGHSSDRLWQGHLFRYELYSEFINACKETPDGTGAGDLDCDGKCMSVFLMDKDGDFIQEDGMGSFRKNDPPDAAPCYQAEACKSKAGRTCAVAGTGLATEYWDAQKALQVSTWRSDRKVYAVVDDKDSAGDASPDGKIDAHDTVFRLEPTDAVATKLLPYLALENGVCTQLSLKLGAAGDAATSNAVLASRLFCAKTLIRYVLGADVFNENEAKSSAVWPKAATDAGQDTLPNRHLMLGDIFHSAPVVVDPPLPPDGVLCPNGLHNQCLTSLWSTPVPDLLTTEDAYAGYAKSATYEDRRKVVLVGANDGLLHAFDGGAWVAGQDDETTTGIDESKAPFDGYYTRGSGAELWGFLPPDLLPKLGLLVTQGHQLFVDGSPMVRDVWVDGSSNALGAGSKDGKKAKTEFHTVAVVGERRGGTHYFALDLTDAAQLPADNADDAAAPRFLWIYPQPGDPQSLAMGSTYSDFLPIAPPIGPVRIKSDATSNALFGGLPQSTLKMALPGATPTTTVDVPYHERWVALLSGGFDPQYVRGRGVHMVDVWTGAELFDFSLPASGCGVANEDLRCKLRAPVPATAAMLTWGKGARRREASPNDGYFDTATFGDAAGQLWVLRFSDPGELDATTKKVTNWYGARAFQLQACAAQPFFYITANASIPGGILRTFLGTGDRYNLLDRFGGTCGPDNIRACAQRSCSVTVASDSNFVWSSGLGKEAGSTTLGSSCSASAARSQTTPTASACTLSAQAKITIDCTGSNDTEKNVTVTCADGADGLSCSRSGTNGLTVDLGDSTAPITNHNWFFSIRIFGDDANRPVFRTATEAATYDSNRVTLAGATDTATSLVLIDGNPPAPTPTSTAPTYADASSAGWAIYYNHDGQITADDHVYPASRYDERTSSTTAIYRWLSWNTIQTASQPGVSRRGGSNCAVAKCTAENRRIAYHYVVDPVRGSPVLEEDGQKVFAHAQNTLVPTMGDQATVFVNQKGQVQVGLTAVNPEKGATNIPTAVSRDPVPSYGVIQVSRDLHACRHADTAPADGTCK